MPAISPESLYGAVHLAGDGHLDPHGATHAVADAARALGVRIRTGVRVTGFELSARREITHVLTDAGPIATELVVNAAGMWAPQVAAMVGAFIPSTPVDHQHIALKAVPGSELPREMPCFRDPDNLVYGKSEQGGMVFGGYELDPRSRWEDGVPWEHAAQSLPPDWERFAPLMAGAIRRFPFLADAEAIRLVCHPDAMTPDANPLLGPLPGVRGFWVAAGLSLNGFGGGGGIGRAMAGWITAGDPGVDIGPYRAWRFGDTYRDPGSRPGLRARRTPTTTGSATRSTRTWRAGRDGCRRSMGGSRRRARSSARRPAGSGPTTTTRSAAGAARAGTRRATAGHGRPGSSGSAPRRAPSASGPASSTSRRSARSPSRGRARCGLLQRVSANDIDRPVGSVGLHPVVRRARRDRRRRHRHAPGRRPVPGRDRRRVPRVGDRPGCERPPRGLTTPTSTIRDVSGDLATIGLWGPRARDVVVAAGAPADEVGNDAIPMRRAGSIHVGPAPVHAARISYAGELGWELTMPTDWAVGVWDRIRAAGAGSASNPSATAPSTRSAWRRATATTAPT